MTSPMPRYPVYVPSKGRYETCYTARFLIKDKVPFYLVVEPGEVDAYRHHFPEQNFLVLPRDNMRLLGARNWIREHSIAEGYDRHWQLDDNIRGTLKLHKGKRIPCDSGLALAAVEDFTDRYTNIGVSGMNYDTFVTDKPSSPFFLNAKVYSASLINNRMPYKWRLIYNDDTDICLQVLTGGMTTVCFNVYMINKIRTMVVKGGNTDDLYRGDGRLKMARMLERQWPYVVETDRRFQRPQHVIRYNWHRFDTPLIRRDDIDWDEIEDSKPGVKLVQASDEVKSAKLRDMLDSQEITNGTTRKTAETG